MWNRQIAAFSNKIRCVAPALPGYDGRLPVEADINLYADDVISQLQTAGVTRAIVVGLSLGGYVAFKVLERLSSGRVPVDHLSVHSPLSIVGLVLCDTKAEADDPAAFENRTMAAARARTEGIGWVPDAMIPVLLGPSDLPGYEAAAAEVRAMILACTPETYARTQETIRDRSDSLHLLPGISFPAAVIVGAHDRITPPGSMKRLAMQITGSGPSTHPLCCTGLSACGYYEIPDAGHLPNIENPEAFNAALESFLSRDFSFPV
jgi:pimeloyl-ACP methyl ester carboxylesterase